MSINEMVMAVAVEQAARAFGFWVDGEPFISDLDDEQVDVEALVALALFDRSMAPA